MWDDWDEVERAQAAADAPRPPRKTQERRDEPLVTLSPVVYVAPTEPSTTLPERPKIEMARGLKLIAKFYRTKIG